MIVSLNWLKKYVDINIPLDELSKLIGARLVEIEDVVSLKEKYQDVRIVKVINATKMEGSDHLSVVMIDDGRVNTEVKRDASGFIQVVCGAPNIRTGQTVVWLPPNSIVPETYHKTEQFKLESRNLRGVISNGMIASGRELDFSDSHDGILVIEEEVKPGLSLVDYLELDDYLIDIENKSLTHRPDCFGIIGFARELAGIQSKKFVNPEWFINPDVSQEKAQDNKIDLKVSIDDQELSSRYTAVVMSQVDNSKTTPLTIQSFLSRIGIKSINPVVDVTNYLMVVTGQPLHAFDYDKVVAVSNGLPEIHVRAGRNGEKLELLDKKIIELSSDDIVIAAGETAIGLAGAMGGLSTAIDSNTKNIIIESATFNLYNLRSTQMRHGIFSEAITRFTKGQPAELSKRVLLEAVKLINQWSGAVCVSAIAEDYPINQGTVELTLSAKKINAILGTSYNQQDIVSTLENVGFNVLGGVNDLNIAVPFWRADIHIQEDVAEEVGRICGFDDVKPTLPVRNFTATDASDFDKFRSTIRQVLVRAGANEVLTYSFIHGNILQKVGQNEDNSYRIVNSISPELQYYRQSLAPSLLGLIHPNIKQGFDEFALFELNKVHPKSAGLNSEGVPVELNNLALVMASKTKKPGAAFYEARKILDYLSGMLGIELIYRQLKSNDIDATSKPFEYRRGAEVVTKSGVVLGVLGEMRRQVAKEFKLPEYMAGFEINSVALFDYYQSNRKISYSLISRYPSIVRDICFQVSIDTTYSSLFEAVKESLANVDLETNVVPVDIYRAETTANKNITLRINLNSHDHTLTSDEASLIVNQVIESVSRQLDIKVI